MFLDMPDTFAGVLVHFSLVAMLPENCHKYIAEGAREEIIAINLCYPIMGIFDKKNPS